MTTIKGFIKDYNGNPLLPITRGELVLDSQGTPAFRSSEFIAQAPSTGFDGLPGLITAAEKALINNLGDGSGTGTIFEIYSQLNELFKIGINVNGTKLSFYNDDKQATPISFINNDNNIVVTNNGNEIVLNLASKNYGKTVKNIVNKIEVDEFGRVTNVEGSDILNNITINNGKVSASITDSSDGTAIANKSYVDSKFNTANGVALGALKFIGVRSTQTELDNIGANLTSNVNSYFKIGADGLELPSQYILGEESSNISLKVGDTVIVHTNDEGDTGFVHIPSGDEPITSITVKDSSVDKISNAVGQVAFTFDAPFGVSKESDNEVKISLPTLSADNTVEVGLLSRTDYDNFKTYSAKSIQYVPTITNQSASHYEIGKISFGDDYRLIYGQDTTYTLGLISDYTSGDDAGKDPKLLLTSSLGDDSNIQFIGSDGIKIKKDGNTVKITPNITSNTTFITVSNGSVIGVKLGNVGDDGKIENGLIDYQTTINYVAEVHQNAAHFKAITNSLTGTENGTNSYCYGGPNLISVISVEI